MPRRCFPFRVTFMSDPMLCERFMALPPLAWQGGHSYEEASALEAKDCPRLVWASYHITHSIWPKLLYLIGVCICMDVGLILLPSQSKTEILPERGEAYLPLTKGQETR